MIRKKFLFATSEVLANGGQGFFPQDIRRLYGIPQELDGEGQTIGILEFSNGYNMRDAVQFWKSHGIVPPQVQFVSVDGTPNDQGRNQEDEEASLDLQWAGAIAPKATLVVYEANAGDTYQTFADAMIQTLEYILKDTQYQPSVLSISYGDAESTFGTDQVKRWADLIQQLSAKGIAVCVASGDQGAYGLHDLSGSPVRHADAPATATYAVAVGGTSLQPDGTETAWSYSGPQNGGATGGGFSSVFPAPDYQRFLGQSGRGIPDISLNADPATGYQIVFQGRSTVVGGTSVACPVFAAIVALTNQARAKTGLPPLQNLTPLLYQQTDQLGYRDITVGNNTFNNVTGYQATSGWDACTGWGSIIASKFIQAFSSVNLTQPNPNPNPSPIPTPSPNPAPNQEIIHIQANIKKVEADVHQHGVSHHHLLINQVKVLSAVGVHPDQIGQELFVAIRYGDSEGIPHPIPGLHAGNEIELQGVYVERNHIYPSIGNPGDPVLHYTHHPYGFVIYKGVRYE